MRITILLLAILIFSCQTNQNSNQNNDSDENLTLPEKLIGEWHNLSLRVEIQGDSLEIFEADTSNWEEKLGIKIIETFFREDGTYNSEHYTLEDSLFLNTQGTWITEDDNMTFYQNHPEPDTQNCKVSIDGKIVYFDCMLDWDGDGSADDQYIGVQQKQ